MKKILLAFCMVALLASCSKNTPWEYKVVKVEGKPAETLADYGALVYGEQTAMLNKMGKEGWELVNVRNVIDESGNISSRHPDIH